MTPPDTPLTCTWGIEASTKKDGTIREAHACGRTATIVFSRHTEWYPRCNLHNTAEARMRAALDGYDTHYLDVLEFAL